MSGINLWRGSLLPLGCEAAPKKYCERCALEREQAPSPQPLVSLRGCVSLQLQIIQHPIHRQLPEHDQLRNPQQHMPLRRVEHPREIIGHDLGRGQRFAGIGQQFFAVDAGGDFVDGVGLIKVKSPGSWSCHVSLQYEGVAAIRGSQTGTLEPADPNVSHVQPP